MRDVCFPKYTTAVSIKELSKHFFYHILPITIGTPEEEGWGKVKNRINRCHLFRFIQTG